jgi:hypothetical protein
MEAAEKKFEYKNIRLHGRVMLPVSLCRGRVVFAVRSEAEIDIPV